MKKLKGILLAGGKGTRLYPMTAIASKQLQPVFNKPMIYYPLTTMVMAGVREVLLISGPDQLPFFKQLLGDGSQYGIEIEYAAQAEPRGIAEALIIGDEFAGNDPIFLMLGDNLIYGNLDVVRRARDRMGEDEATVFAYMVSNPSDYGVVEFDAHGKAVSLEEKPKAPKSNWAVPGMYLYAPGAAARAKRQKPSARGELEITDLNRMYLQEGKLRVSRLGRGMAWFDTGTPSSLLDASSFVHAIESRQGLYVGCPEEAAVRVGFLGAQGLRKAIERLPSSPYREYIERLEEELQLPPASEFPPAIK